METSADFNVWKNCDKSGFQQGNDKGERATELEPNARNIGQYNNMPEKSSIQDTDNLQELKELKAKEERKKIYDGLNDRYLEKCVVYRHLIAVTYSLADFIIANRKEGIGQRYGLVRDFTPLTNCEGFDRSYKERY